MRAPQYPLQSNEEMLGEVLEWQYKSWEKDPNRRTVAIAAIVIAGLAGLLIFHHPLFAIIGMVVIFVSTAELFLPVKYKLDANEARQQCGLSVTAIPWTEVRRLVTQGDGVRLSPFEKPNRLDAFRGVFLRYASNEDQVLGKIRELWQIDGSSLEGKTDAGTEGGLDREGRPSDAQAGIGDPLDPLS